MRDLVAVVVAVGLCGCGSARVDAGAPSGGGDAAAVSGGAERATPSAAGRGGAEAGHGGAGAVAPMDASTPDTGAAPEAGASPDAGAAHDAGAAPDAGTGAAMCQRCSAYAAAVQSGTLEPTELDSLSGLAASRKHPGIVFAHNDHDRPVVYALDRQGHMHARITLEGVSASDIEDIALGPCGSDTCVYLGDIGDNSVQRTEYGILRFVEPAIPDAPGTTELKPQTESFRFTYEDGSHNAESLMVAPSGMLYVITKLAPGTGGAVTATGPSSVYRLALQSGMVGHATKLATLTLPKSGEKALSAAAAHPCGSSFLVRTYDRVYEYMAPSGGDFEAAFSATPSMLAAPDEPQSEGIDYASDGRGFITSGEGAHAPIFQTSCARY
jgi:hypothetical protein